MSQLTLCGAGPSSPAVAVLPQTASLIGEWYGNDFDATRVAIPNRRSEEPLAANLLTTLRGMFASTRYFAATNTTVTDDNATGPNGEAHASTVVWGSADAVLQLSDIGNLAAGTYTFSLDIKTTDAATVDVRMTGGATTETKTVNGTWTTYSVTFTLGSPAEPTLILRSKDTSTPANLAIDNWRLHPGSSDLGVDVLGGHLYFGRSQYNTARHPTSVSNGVIVQNAANRYGFLQFEEDVELTDWTAMVICRRAASNAGTAEYALNNAKSAAVWALPYCEGDGGPTFIYGGSSVTSINNYGRKGFWNTTGDWQVITNRYSGSEASIWSEDVKSGFVTTAGRTATIRNLLLNHIGTGGGSNYAKMDVYAIVMWNAALSDADIVQAYEYFYDLAAQDGIDLSPFPVITIAEGDSITEGTGATQQQGSYPRRANANLDPRTSGRIAAVSGSTFAGVLSRKTDNLTVFPANKRGRTYRYTLLIGRNDHAALIAGGEADYADDIADHMADMLASGFDEVVLCTMLPSTLTNWNTARNNFNAIITADGWASSRGITICDFAADATMGPDAAASDTGLYPDGTHPNDTGYNALELVYRATMNAL